MLAGELTPQCGDALLGITGLLVIGVSRNKQAIGINRTLRFGLIELVLGRLLFKNGRKLEFGEWDPRICPV